MSEKYSGPKPSNHGQNRANFEKQNDKSNANCFNKNRENNKPFNQNNHDGKWASDKPVLSKTKNAYNDKPYGRPVPKDDARKIALLTLTDVNESGAYSQIALNDRLRSSNLEQVDKRLTTELFYGTLENKIKLDFVLFQFINAMPPPQVLDILRMGVYQLLYMYKIPDNAVCDEAVKLTRKQGFESQTGFVNAILRNIIRGKDNLKWPNQDEDPVRYLSIMYSLPENIARRLIATYGLEESKNIISYRPDERSVTIRVIKNEISYEAFERRMSEEGWVWKRGILEGAYRVAKAGDLAKDPDYLAGFFVIQGESSMLAAMAVCANNGETILDACAAPGGKSAYLCQAMSLTGRVHAWDIHEHRVELIKAMAKRLHLDNIRGAVRDSAIIKEDFIGTMDAVLIDAPCTGLGVMINKPDVKYRQSEEDIKNISKLQADILDACCVYVKAEGRLIYSTCTILPEENQLQVASFLQRHNEFVLDTNFDWLPEHFKTRVKDNVLQLQAHEDGLDGFFIAKFKRRV